MSGRNLVAKTQIVIADFYETPEKATTALLDNVNFIGSVLEPACGSGSMSDVLQGKGFPTFSSDLRTDSDVYGKSDMDFLKQPYERGSFNNVITNPPYSLGQKFVEEALRVARHKVAMLLRINFLEAGCRFKFFKDTPLESVWIFTSRLTMYPAKTVTDMLLASDLPSDRKKALNGLNGGTACHAWFVWDHCLPKGTEPVIRWLPPRPKKRSKK